MYQLMYCCLCCFSLTFQFCVTKYSNSIYFNLYFNEVKYTINAQTIQLYRRFAAELPSRSFNDTGFQLQVTFAGNGEGK